ncbi:MAG TPA: hybrid sensor histidine kinase/response regulator [Candidatus Omnitrophota bacterium]|nr:hybrid sensor histidine kinase/response regulator [Candidatus Omnitrophota bacterium]
MTKKILIVDDSPLVHQIFGSILEESGYEILHAEDGLIAINKAFAELPDLILLDIWMPKINGYQVCRLLKDHLSTRDIPVIIITGEGNKGFVENPRNWSFQTGADGYLGKERADDLVKTVQSVLGQSGPREKSEGIREPMSELEILTALSKLLDRQLYLDVTRLKELDERKNAFVANVSHEFKSPLAIIGGFLENLKDGLYGQVSPKQKEVMEIAMRTTRRLNRLVMDMLDLSKIEAGKMKLSKDRVDMKEIVNDVVGSFAAEIAKKNMKIETEIPSGEVSLTGDKDRLTQVVINLFGNALKYTPEGGRVEVKLSAQTDEIGLEVRDSGPGIAAEDREKVFDKFERLTAEKQEGTGLGLPIAKDIVVLHGGRIWVESEPGKGSNFIVRLPPGGNPER